MSISRALIYADQENYYWSKRVWKVREMEACVSIWEGKMIYSLLKLCVGWFQKAKTI